LACQACAIVNSKLLSEHELHDIQQHSIPTKILENELQDIQQHLVPAKNSVAKDESILEGDVCEPEALSGSSLVLEHSQSVVSVDNSMEFDRLLCSVEDCLSDASVSDDIRVAFNQIRACLIEIGNLTIVVRRPLPKLIENKTVKKWLCLVNKCLHLCMQNQSISFTQCNCLVYAGSMAVAKLSDQCTNRERTSGKGRGAWKDRLESQIQKLRGHVSQLLAINEASLLTARLKHLKLYLFKLYRIADGTSFSIAVETLKQRITSLAARKRRYQERLLRFWQNNTFRRNQKLFYRNLKSGVKCDYTGEPVQSELVSFWKGIFECNSSANLDNSWLLYLKEKFAQEIVSEDTSPAITSDILSAALCRLKNWASPGPDGIQGFWWKRLSSVHIFLCEHYHQFLSGSEIFPSRFPTGRTLLIPKSSELASPQSYRPITCLNIAYKLWTGCLTSLLSHHCERHQIIHPAQKGCSRGQYGCIDHLLLTNSVWRQVKSRCRSLAVAWIDYKKAYDSVPHNWLLECLRLFQFPPILVSCLERLLPLWRSTLFLQVPDKAAVCLSEVSIRCGIFQGDTMSPLLFCLALNPLSYLLDNLKGYKVSTAVNLTHLMYMDDIKLFAQNDSYLQSLVDTVRTFSDDICMKFGFQKCAKLTVKRGKCTLSGTLSSLGDEIEELDYGETYRYLGFPETGGIDHDVSKSIITSEFHRRVKLIWGSLLSGQYKVQATNSFCVPLLSYGFGIVEWTKAEIAQFDVVVRKSLTEFNSHHPRSAIERLYLPRKSGGRGLLCIEHLYQRRLLLLSRHLQTSTDALVHACCELMSQFPPRKSILVKANEVAASLSIDEILTYDAVDLKDVVCSKQKKKLLESLSVKPLHGKFYSWFQSSNVDVARSFRWLHYSLHSESESTIFAIQDQVLCTRVYQAKIMQIPVQSIICRVCHEQEETIQHLLSGCSVLASTSYIERHNMVGRVLHWHLCKFFQLPFASCWTKHYPLPVTENSNAKILWDFGLVTDNPISSNRPDIVLFYKQEQRIIFFEISCPADINIFAKELEKENKYRPLVREISFCYNQPVNVIPVVFGHSGMVTCNQLSHLKRIPNYNESLFNNLQKAAILGTISVLQSVNIGHA